MKRRNELQRRPLRGSRSATGFTLIELMIVVAIIAIIASIAIPNLIAARQRANETAAINVLRNICTAQAQFHQGGRADEDVDMVGEYGFLGELSGGCAVRGTSIIASNLTHSMAIVDGNGEVNRNGYIYRMYLSVPGGTGQREQAGGGIAAGIVDPDRAEISWICYAYPTTYGNSGVKTYFMSIHSTMLYVDAPLYQGPNNALLQGGAALLGSDATDVTGFPAIAQIGADGNTWLQVQ